MHFNLIDALLLYYGHHQVFSHSGGHLQDDFFEHKNTIIIKICLNQSIVLKNHIISG